MANQVTTVGNLFKLEKTGKPTKYYNKKDVSVVFRGDSVQIASEYLEEVVEYDISTFSGSTDGVTFTTYSSEADIANFLGTQMGVTAAATEGTALAGHSGYSHSGAFAGKPLSNQYAWEAGIGINYLQSDVDAGTYKVFSLDRDVHLAVDQPYWADPVPGDITDIGLFAGDNLPNGVTSLFDYSYDFDANYPASTGTGFEGSTGRIKLNECVTGDLLKVRFDFNVIPQISNTTVEPALWYSNRDASDNITFTFPLTASPIFYGTGSVGNSYLNRVEISAWVHSSEDLNALTLPAIKSDNPVIIQPLGLLTTIIR